MTLRPISVAIFAAIGLLVGCPGNREPESACPTPKCPVGGEVVSEAEAESGVEIGGGANATGGTATFKRYGAGKCKYACRFPPCPNGASPNITAEQFRCEVLCPVGHIKDAAGNCIKSCPDGWGRSAGGDCVKPRPCPEWVDASGGQVPADAFVGGKEPQWELYVCRASTASGVVPGKLINGWGCYVADGAQERVAPSYQVLTTPGCKLTWAPAPAGVAPSKSLEASPDGSAAVRVCRASHEGGQHIGFTGWNTNHDCVLSYGGRAHRVGNFEVLQRP